MSSIIRATTTSGLQVAPDNSGSLQLQTNGTTAAVTIDTSQNVGIGTTTPSDKLEVSAVAPATVMTSTSTTGYSIVRFKNTATSGRTYEWALGGSGTGAQAGAMYLYDATASAVRMQIDSDGNVGFGTTTITTGYTGGNGSLTLQNAKSIAFNNASNTWGTATTGAAITYFTDNNLYIDAKDSASNMLFRVNGATERLRITSTGTLTSQATYDNTAAGSTVVVTSAGLVRRTSSSLKYKKDVETLEQTIVDNAVNNLRPVWYRTKNADGDDKATWSHIGLIAEEVDLVEPRLVKYKTVEVTQDENGANVTTELETPVPEDVDYAKLSVILLAKVKQLESRIAVLEAK
jgi:hypothetical protein